MADTFLYQVNVTRDCNLRCTHCYIHSDAKAASKEMHESELIRIVEGIRHHMSSNGRRRAEIHLIGGEPTMLGLPFFESAVPKLRTILDKQAFDYELMLVTNLLTEQALDIAPLFDRVSTSFEVASRFISTKGRAIPALQNKWERAVSKAIGMGIDLGITTAVTKHAVDLGAPELLGYLSSLGLKKIHLGFFIPGGDGEVNMATVAPTHVETSRFMIAATDWYLSRRDADPGLMINPCESVLMAVHTGQPSEDIVCPIIPGSMDINWDGNAISCIEKGGAKSPPWSGNVLQTSVAEVASGPAFQREVIKANKPRKACVGCDEYEICRTGCGVLHDHWRDDDPECPGFKTFLSYIRRLYESGVMPRQLKMGRFC